MEHAIVHFPEERMDARPLQTYADRSCRKVRLQPVRPDKHRSLGDHADDIHTETVDASSRTISSSYQRLRRGPSDFPSSIRLFFAKAVQIGIRCACQVPCGTAEAGTPVVRFFPFFALPDIVITMRIVLELWLINHACSSEVWLTTRSITILICDDVLRKQTVEIFHCTEISP